MLRRVIDEWRRVGITGTLVNAGLANWYGGTVGNLTNTATLTIDTNFPIVTP